MSFADNAARTSPLWDTFDPSAITGATWKVSDSAPVGICTLAAVRAPTGGGTLIFKQASTWVTPPPGSSYDALDGTFTRVFAANEALINVQITEIVKAGSTAGTWEIAL
jgi:hypothetical protein